MSDVGLSFVVPRATGTHGDVFAAVGLADMLSTIPKLSPLKITEQSAGFEVTCPRTLTDDDLSLLPHTPGYQFLKPNDKATVPPNVDFFDYKVNKDRADRYRSMVQALKGEKPDTEMAAQLELLRPPSGWRLWQVLNVLQGDETSNKVHLGILGLPTPAFRAQVATELRQLGRTHRPEVGWTASTVQLFTPNAAKGYARLKPDSTGRNDKTKDQWTDPFLEWLRYRGYFDVACPYFLGSKGENIRLLCPVPKRITFKTLQQVTARLMQAAVFARQGSKLDCLVVLELAGLLIRHSQEFRDPDAEPFDELSMADASPSDLISGITVTHYQSMGSSKAVSAMSTLALPGWFKIASHEDAVAWREILAEHRAIVRGLQDNHSDEIGLLIGYRRFLEDRSLAAYWRLLEFMERYGAFLVKAREQGRRVRAFTTTNHRRLTTAMAGHLTAILDGEGFQAVATAVRRATVNAQAQKAMGVKNYRDIRYDLLPELRRSREVPGNSFVEVVSDFISKYNWENGRRREQKLPAPANVTTEQLTQFIELVEEHKPPLVGALLCAYGSCREPREPEGQALGEAGPEGTTDQVSEE